MELDLNQLLQEAVHQRDALMTAILKTARAVGICNNDGTVTGPHLLMFCDDIITVFDGMETRIKELEAKVASLQPSSDTGD